MSTLRNPLSKHTSEDIDLWMPVRTFRPLDEDNNTGMQTSYVDLIDVTGTSLIDRLAPTRDGHGIQNPFTILGLDKTRIICDCPVTLYAFGNVLILISSL